MRGCFIPRPSYCFSISLICRIWIYFLVLHKYSQRTMNYLLCCLKFCNAMGVLVAVSASPSLLMCFFSGMWVLGFLPIHTRGSLGRGCLKLSKRERLQHCFVRRGQSRNTQKSALRQAGASGVWARGKAPLSVLGRSGTSHGEVGCLWAKHSCRRCSAVNGVLVVSGTV